MFMNSKYIFSIVFTFLNISTEKKKLSGEAETFSETCEGKGGQFFLNNHLHCQDSGAQ